ncbi:MAG: hypothetical protein IJ157_06385 [Clostridia bacterium]|nr:hypothetical protein [Clostridia bacterium]
MSILAGIRQAEQRKTEIRSEHIALALCYAFALYSLAHFGLSEDQTGQAQAVETMLLLLLPILMEKTLHCRMAAWLSVYATLHCLGPMIGHSYQLYYTTVWWDKLQHTSSGILFAVIGLYIPILLNGDQPVSLPLRVFCAVCFSITLSALWEILEFASDQLFATDTQNDTYLTAINSYFLGAAPGELGHIAEIESVIVNGIEMPGYIDIGLIDTMHDMMVQTLGALSVGITAALDKGRHPAIILTKVPGRQKSHQNEQAVSGFSTVNPL